MGEHRFSGKLESIPYCIYYGDTDSLFFRKSQFEKIKHFFRAEVPKEEINRFHEMYPNRPIKVQENIGYLCDDYNKNFITKWKFNESTNFIEPLEYNMTEIDKFIALSPKCYAFNLKNSDKKVVKVKGLPLKGDYSFIRNLKEEKKVTLDILNEIYADYKLFLLNNRMQTINEKAKWEDEFNFEVKIPHRMKRVAFQTIQSEQYYTLRDIELKRSIYKTIHNARELISVNDEINYTVPWGWIPIESEEVLKKSHFVRNLNAF